MPFRTIAAVARLAKVAPGMSLQPQLLLTQVVVVVVVVGQVVGQELAVAVAP